MSIFVIIYINNDIIVVWKIEKSYLFVSIAVLLWASTAAIAKLLLQNLSGIQIMFYSFIFAILGLFSIVIAQGKLKV